MFSISHADIEKILTGFGIYSKVTDITELQRYNYDRDNADSKHVRLIVKVETESAPALVMRFKSEEGVTRELIEAQCRFADTMRQNGIITPMQYRCGDDFTAQYAADGYDVTVTVEDFAENEIKIVDETVAEKTGRLLAQMHNISERFDLHVKNRVLFDPLGENDLFDIEEFMTLGKTIAGDEKAIFDDIAGTYDGYMRILSPLKERRRFAVQGDLSDCNMYTTVSGDVGVFDYNNCGDNELFCDAVMQAVFVSRLMDYPDDASDGYDKKLLMSFLRGYRSERDFTDEERAFYPYLYAIIDAFWWLGHLDKWTEAIKSGDREKTHDGLVRVLHRLKNAEDIK